MKRMLCIVSLLLMLSASVHASAADLSSLDLFSYLSDSDILRARNILSEELMKRGYLEFTLSKGEYTVGEDIHPGVYSLASPELGISICRVYSADGEYITFRSIDYDWRFHEFVEANGLGQIELTTGQVLKILGYPMTFYKY